MAKKRTSLWDKVAAEDRVRMDEIFAPLMDLDPKDTVNKINERIDLYNQELRAKSKPKEDLMVGLECVVKEADFYLRTAVASGVVLYGGPAPFSYKTGHFSNVVLVVESSSPVKKLEIDGWPRLETGDIIRAYILKGTEKAEKFPFDQFHDPRREPKVHWVERDYEAVEKPSKIEKLRNGRVVATYHNS